MCVNAGFVPVSLPGLFTPNLPGYEQKSHMRQTLLAPLQGNRIFTEAADNEASPEDGAEVDGELGQGKITFLFG